MRKKIQLSLILALTIFNSMAVLPEKVVVLTFDDAVISQYTYVAKLLKDYGFGATFFVCEFPSKTEEEREKLHELGTNKRPL